MTVLHFLIVTNFSSYHFCQCGQSGNKKLILNERILMKISEIRDNIINYNMRFVRLPKGCVDEAVLYNSVQDVFLCRRDWKHMGAEVVNYLSIVMPEYVTIYMRFHKDLDRKSYERYLLKYLVCSISARMGSTTLRFAHHERGWARSSPSLLSIHTSSPWVYS